MARLDVIEIELGDIESVVQLHERLMDQLQFPGWYGKNWNAFWDAIVGLVDMPHTLRLKNWAELERKFPLDAKLMTDCLCDMEKQFPSFAAQIDHI
ncbi:barstar family protein [Ralstonia pseudosolanacearum]|uniref:barstar family protein n=1 Tax=Ralstonia pseudosolanacearum TaxID=1310165 RepID=UPI0024A6427B|nr:barstar family protein [Ralstonia pseudosolanacearum]